MSNSSFGLKVRKRDVDQWQFKKKNKTKEKNNYMSDIIIKKILSLSEDAFWAVHMWPVSRTLYWELTCMLQCWHRSSSHRQWSWAPRLVLRGETSQIFCMQLSGVHFHHRHGGVLTLCSAGTEITWPLSPKQVWLKSCGSVQLVF